MYEGLGISNLITKVVEGYHATIFAYGQTGSGKTFTMEGNEREQDTSNFNQNHQKLDQGLIQRSVSDLFE